MHPASHVDEIESICQGGGGRIDLDTAAVPATWEAALRAAGGACAAVDALIEDGVPAAFCAMRPPGHHAEAARAMGFCFFNSVAVAARHALAAHGLERVLIVDWDVHHGNGTNDIFHASREVLFASIHQSPLYPGTGQASDVGSGAGRGYTINLPVPGGSGDERFASLVEHVIVPAARVFAPQLVLVSAGFDAHRLDPLASCALSEEGYVAMAASLRRLADELEAPLGMVLEGGYSTAALAASCVALMPVLAGSEPGPDLSSLPVDPLAAAARDRLGTFWPALATSA